MSLQESKGAIGTSILIKNSSIVKQALNIFESFNHVQNVTFQFFSASSRPNFERWLSLIKFLIGFSDEKKQTCRWVIW